MYADAVHRIRMYRRHLAARWSQQVAQAPRASPIWQDAARVDRHALACMDALVEAAVAGRPEAFGEFAARLAGELFALQVPLDEVIRALLQIKPLILGFLGDADLPSTDDIATVSLLNSLISLGVLEAIRRHERQQDRRALALQDQIDELRERVRRQVLVDPATGLFNANYFGLAVRREVHRSQRFGRTFTIGLVTLDQDEDIRDALGEDGLRAVTIQLAEVLTRSMRQVDVRAALGPGRFGIILPETSLDGAFVLAERIRTTVERTAFVLPEHPFPLTQTVSIGLACYPHDGEDDQALLARAEEALARAQAGRNATVFAATAQDF